MVFHDAGDGNYDDVLSKYRIQVAAGDSTVFFFWTMLLKSSSKDIPVESVTKQTHAVRKTNQKLLTLL